jgi:hypothetical protein
MDECTDQKTYSEIKHLNKRVPAAHWNYLKTSLTQDTAFFLHDQRNTAFWSPHQGC